MQTPVTLTSGRSCFYNMGWFIDALPNGAAYLWHTGSVSGFRCCHYHALAGGVTAMMFLNVDSDAIGSIAFDTIEADARAEARRVGKEGVGTSRSGWSPVHKKTTKERAMK